MASDSKVWLITGCSTGFGREMTLVALRRGDKVIATARNPEKIKDLEAHGAQTIALDVLAGEEEMRRIIKGAVDLYGRIDILVNNAGYILVGGVEECSPSEIQQQFSTNVFGQLSVIRAVLPYMRAARSGVIANLGSIGGWTGTTGAGIYCSTKAAIVSVSEALRLEVQHLGIDVTVIEPGYFRTKLLSGNNRIVAENTIDDLKPAVAAHKDLLAATDNNQPGDPAKGAQLIVEVLTKSGRCEGKAIPARLALGKDAVEYIGGVMDKNRATLDEWAPLVSSTDIDGLAS